MLHKHAFEMIPHLNEGIKLFGSAFLDYQHREKEHFERLESKFTKTKLDQILDIFDKQIDEYLDHKEGEINEVELPNLRGSKG